MDSTTIIEMIGTQGSWALLSAALILYILKAQEKRDEVQENRELKYQEIIGKMADKLEALNHLLEDVTEIKEKIK